MEINENNLCFSPNTLDKIVFGGAIRTINEVNEIK